MHWHARFYLAVLSKIFFLLRFVNDDLLTVYKLLIKFWSTGSRARGPHLPTCADLAYEKWLWSLYNLWASRLTIVKMFFLEFPKIWKNEGLSGPGQETFLWLIPQVDKEGTGHPNNYPALRDQRFQAYKLCLAVPQRQGMSRRSFYCSHFDSAASASSAEIDKEDDVVPPSCGRVANLRTNNYLRNHRLGNALCLCLAPLLARWTRLCCAGARPKVRCNWICSQNLRLSSGTGFGSNCQMTDRGSNLDPNFNSAAWLTSCKDLPAPKSLNKLSGVLFRSVENAEIEDCSESIPTLIPQTAHLQPEV